MGYVGRTLMLVEHEYPGDARVSKEALALTEKGYLVSVIALRDEGEKPFEKIDGIDVYRVPKITIFRKTGGYGVNKLHFHDKIKIIFGFAAEYVYFTVYCLIISLRVLLRTGFDVVHAHNPPDTLFAVGLFYKALGKKFVFDHHDLSPELYLCRANGKKGLVYRTLLYFEKLSCRLADIIIATNMSYKNKEIERGKVRPEKIFIVRNGPDLNRAGLVNPHDKSKKLRKNLLVYVGEMNPQDGVDYLLRSLQKLICQLDRKDFYCMIIGRGDSLPDLKELAHNLEIDDYVYFTGYIPEDDLIRYLSAADICLDPNPLNSFNDNSTWIKIMEYMSFGKPIVSFDLKETRISAREAATYVRPNDELEFAKAIARLMDNPKLRQKMGKYGRERVETELSWNIVSKELLKAYEVLFNGSFKE